VTAKPDFRLAPQTPIRPARLQFQFTPPFPSAYSFEMHFGCQGAPPGHVFVTLTPEELDRAYRDSVNLLNAKSFQEAMRVIFPIFLGQKGQAA
jgi:hypothetical protein